MISFIYIALYLMKRVEKQRSSPFYLSNVVFILIVAVIYLSEKILNGRKYNDSSLNVMPFAFSAPNISGIYGLQSNGCNDGFYVSTSSDLVSNSLYLLFVVLYIIFARILKYSGEMEWYSKVLYKIIRNASHHTQTHTYMHRLNEML